MGPGIRFYKVFHKDHKGHFQLYVSGISRDMFQDPTSRGLVLASINKDTLQALLVQVQIGRSQDGHQEPEN